MSTDVESDGHSGGSACLGDELVRHKMRAVPRRGYVSPRAGAGPRARAGRAVGGPASPLVRLAQLTPGARFRAQGLGRALAGSRNGDTALSARRRRRRRSRPCSRRRGPPSVQQLRECAHGSRLRPSASIRRPTPRALAVSSRSGSASLTASDDTDRRRSSPVLSHMTLFGLGVGLVITLAGVSAPHRSHMGREPGRFRWGVTKRAVADESVKHTSRGDTVTDTQSESGGAVREAMGQAAEKSRETAQQGIEKAKQTAGEARGVLTRQLDERSTMAGERANAFAQAAHRVADESAGRATRRRPG